MTITEHNRIRRAQKISFVNAIDVEIVINEIDVFAETMNECFKEMSPAAQANGIMLAHALAKIRTELKK